MSSTDLIGLFDPKDVSRLLKVSLPYVYKLAERGLLPCVRWPAEGGGQRKRTVLRFTRDDVLTFITKHKSA
jgi:hypothetical protein